MEKIYNVKVIPGSKTEGVFEENGLLKVRVKERAEKGNANKALIDLLEKYFKAKVVLRKGFTSRKKVISVEQP